jgi:hypothetical protein
MAVFMGLAIDAASLYLTHARLKRAVDSAAVSAANDFKSGKTIENMTEAAREVLMLHDVDMTTVDLHVYDCLTPNLDTLAPSFDAICPDTTIYSPKKLIWVDATQAAPLYFMQLIGFSQVPLSTNSIAEAAPVDLVIVIDVSESMGNQTPGFVNGNYDPSACNAANDCQPLLDAKTAAQALVDSLYEGYDQVAIVTYDSIANTHLIDNSNGVDVLLSDKFTDDPLIATDDTYITVADTLNAIQLYDDPPITKIWPTWYSRGFSPDYAGAVFNPVFPDDRDGDGRDIDYPDCGSDPSGSNCCTLDEDRWDSTKDPFGWGGVPCDDDNKLDAYDFDGNGVYTTADTDAANNWLADPKHHSLSINSTCTGCGMRAGSNILKLYGRPNAVWVMVFLSDGAANMTDTHTSDPVLVPTQFPNGYCTSVMDVDFKNDKTWQAPWCIDTKIAADERYCIDDDPLTCPPDSIHQVANPVNNHYTVYDFTLDMIDSTALVKSDNAKELRGNDIAIYSIALGGAGDQVYGVAVGEQLLRYMAAVGDDGDRTTDPCKTTATKTDCGQYYFAPSGDRLLPIFEDIAGRIYTRITQ